MWRLLIITMLSAIVYGCSLIHPYRAELNEADRLVEEYPDSAYRILDRVNRAELVGDADLALYGLLHIEALYRCDKATPEDSLIDFSISYFNRKDDAYHLARAYFYKGMTMLERRGQLSKVLECLKMAEDIASSLDDNTLNHKIYEGLVSVNYQAKCYDMMLKYSKLSLECSQRDGRPFWMAYSLIHAANSFGYLNQDDSACIYADRILPLMDSLPSKERSFFYTAIGCVYHAGGYEEEAKRMLQKSMALTPLPMTYTVLADIYNAEDRNDEAESLWQKALCVNDTFVKISVYRSLIDFYEKIGQPIKALEMARERIKLKDDMIKRREKTKIMEMQLKYDNEVLEKQMYRKLAILESVILVLVIGIFLFLHYYRRKVKIFHSRIDGALSQIHVYEQQIIELENSGRDVSDEVAVLRKEIEHLNKITTDRIAHGKLLYDEIKAGGKMGKWSGDDTNDFIDYYRIYNLHSLLSWEKEYNNPTQRQVVYLILMDMGFDRNDLIEIMGISPVSLRSIKTRLNARKK